MSPRAKKTTKKTPAKRPELAEETTVADLLPAGLPEQAAMEDIEALKTLAGQLSARLDDLQGSVPSQIAEARALAISGDEKLAERFNQILDETKDQISSVATERTAGHNLNSGRIDRVANHAADNHRTVIDENQRLAKRISAIDIDLDKHRRFHDAYGAEAINEASVAQAEKIANLSKVVYVGLLISTAMSAYALICAMGG